MLDESVTAPQILVCGLLAADVVFNVEEIPTQAIKHRADKVSLICGGGGGYAAIACNRLGGRVSLLSRVGDDYFGKFLVSTLVDEGIDCEHVIVNTHSHTPISSVAIDSHGDRQIVNYRDHGNAPVSDSLTLGTPPNAVLVDSRWHEGSIFALELANAHNIPGVIDPEAPASVDAMSLASHIAFSRQGLNDFAPTHSILNGLEKAAAQFSAWVCVTDGENGTHILCGSELITVPSPKIKAVDTLGAGDVWHGAFTLKLAQGANELSAVKFANVAAALKCTRAGGGFSAPELWEVAEFENSGYQ